MVLTQPRGHAVIKDNSVSLAHHSVAALPFRQCRKHICIDAVEKNSCIGSLYIDLSECRSIHHSDPLTCSNTFTPNGIMHAFSRFRKVPRPFPLPDIFEYGTRFHMPLVQRCDADRIRKLSAFATCQCSKRHRHIRWPEGKGTHISRR